MVFRKSTIRVDGNLAKPIITKANETVWGVWSGLFGLANNELIVITLVDNLDLRKPWPDEFEVVDEQLMLATERPNSVSPPSLQGLYVFRSMETESKNIDEIVRLSAQAWKTFEINEEYRSQPIGLFKPRNPGAVSTMWLLTWYDGFKSWEKSRYPHAEAKKAFTKRHALLAKTSAIATRLVT